MAVKDHSLDDKIIDAARAEFLAHGFQKASLHKIAQRAGITTGALYTRYKNKDALFCSLVTDAFSEIRQKFQPLEENYRLAEQTRDAETLLQAIRQEERAYLELLFDHYETCILFFCRSDGSSIQHQIDRMMQQKAAQTIQFLRSVSRKEINFDGIGLILAEQFRYYRLILEKGYSKERAIACMESVESFLDAGWKALFEQIL